MRGHREPQECVAEVQDKWRGAVVPIDIAGEREMAAVLRRLDMVLPGWDPYTWTPPMHVKHGPLS